MVGVGGACADACCRDGWSPGSRCVLLSRTGQQACFCWAAPQTNGVHLHLVSWPKDPQCKLDPGTSCGHLTGPYFHQELDIFTSKILQVLLPGGHFYGFLVLSTSLCQTAPSVPVRGPRRGHHGRWLSQPSKPSATRSTSPKYNSTAGPVTLGAIPNSYSDIKFNVLEMLFEALGV